LKDMSYYTAMAEELGAMHMTAEAIRDTYEFAGKEGSMQSAVPELVSILGEARNKA
jgi:hypothetical protein